jgi:hypothetical protein
MRPTVPWSMETSPWWWAKKPSAALTSASDQSGGVAAASLRNSASLGGSWERSWPGLRVPMVRNRALTPSISLLSMRSETSWSAFGSPTLLAASNSCATFWAVKATG